MWGINAQSHPTYFLLSFLSFPYLSVLFLSLPLLLCSLSLFAPSTSYCLFPFLTFIPLLFFLLSLFDSVIPSLTTLESSLPWSPPHPTPFLFSYSVCPLGLSSSTFYLSSPFLPCLSFPLSQAPTPFLSCSPGLLISLSVTLFTSFAPALSLSLSLSSLSFPLNLSQGVSVSSLAISVSILFLNPSLPYSFSLSIYANLGLPVLCPLAPPHTPPFPLCCSLSSCLSISFFPHTLSLPSQLFPFLLCHSLAPSLSLPPSLSHIYVSLCGSLFWLYVSLALQTLSPQSLHLCVYLAHSRLELSLYLFLSVSSLSSTVSLVLSLSVSILRLHF
ncbi:uncharacterized protein LOC130456225 isoform X2 [Monodelphis domestica]|uniref:uncharacterized protein LOC130456225 isoform X2 n=1 Tax=Monodelphis domestica TaxID=13616 RepID=UPI0024E23BA8|nr:uncharacterized protein LOC130456225 isoform X2 [Monodelphis domestica]